MPHPKPGERCHREHKNIWSGTCRHGLLICSLGGNVGYNNGDTLWQGEHANIRRVSNIGYELPGTKEAPQYHRKAAEEYQVAKKKLVTAESEETVHLTV